MTFQSKKEIMKVGILLAIVFGAVFCINYLRNSAATRLDFLDKYAIPTEFEFNGSKIALAWTDDNTGENLIIQSDKKEYNGFNQADVYFSVTNISKQSQKVDLKFIPAKGDYIEVASIEQINKTNEADLSAGEADNINSGQTNFYKATLKFKPHSKGEFFIEAKGDKGGYGYLDPWYSSSWTYKRAITLQGSKIATTTTAFPVLATTTLADLKTTTNGGKVGNDNGYDIIFVDSDDSTLLNYEREKYASTTGEIAYWIKTDIASSTDKTIYMYYGNAGASDTATTTGVWDDNFVMVQHLQEDPGPGGAGDIKDSTKYAHNGTAEASMTTSDQVAGQIDGSFDFDNTGDNVSVSEFATSTISNWSWSGWFNVSAINTGANYAISNANSTSFYFESARITTNWKNSLSGNVYTNHTLVPVINTWYYIYEEFNAINFCVYINGALSACYNYGVNGYQINMPVSIGNISPPYTTRGWNGKIDEVRVSNTARTAGWITTEYNNQSNIATFLTIGAEETAPVSGSRATQINSPQTSLLTNGLVGYWSFNGADMDWASTTAEALDRSGNSNNGDVINGAKPAAGISGQGLSFDGVDDYVNTNYKIPIVDHNITISGWFNATKTREGNYGLFQNTQYPSGLEAQTEYIYVGTTQFKIVYSFFAGIVQSGASINFADPTYSNFNKWNHFSIVVEHGGGTINLSTFTNGSLTGNTSTSTSFIANPSGVFNIGRSENGPGAPAWSGLIDEARISNTARTQGWITTEYNNQSDVASFLTIGGEESLSVPATRSGGENVKTRIKGGVIFKGGVRF
ncbi:DUF2341 domain-containing protein [Patescibacteria group bacterium]|nr:DUF2341 domain-containing protein [Patescibacteria group bacterium]